ncbi:neuronal acetylcholine receptor subunit non-alpha-3-like [Diprion similis]|uniref:neuronal acetylcholine receptor subunit non-alpha-3-like n=1 Tax=Diprion similis TaxID=362088 RepID=UPI001EF9A3A9|nr:neuronal acetylcholine receptor subunit non-alpha-3-like [Diprion similis]
MQLKFLVLVLDLLAVYSTKFCVDAAQDYCTSNVESASATTRLKKRLLCDYDPTVPPGNPGESTEVQLSLQPKFIDFDESSNTMVFHAWLGMLWQDTRLKWSDEDLPILHVSSDEIWVPPIAHYNSAGGSRGPNGIPKSECLMFSDELTVCVAGLKYVSNCVTDYRNWPFDRHKCTIVLASWAYKAEEINYSAFNNWGIFPELGVFGFTPNAQWKLLLLEHTQVEDGIAEGYTFPTIIYTVVLERNSDSMRAVILAPAILLVVLTLTVLWLDPISVERSVVAVLNLICNLICVMNLNEQVPFNGSTTPSILVFHQGSIVIASLALLLTILLRQMMKLSVSAPDWLASAASSILASRAGQLILLTTLDPKAAAAVRADEENAGLTTSSDSSIKIKSGSTNVWRHLAALLDRLAFATVLLTYLIMIIVLTPRNDVFEVPDVPSFDFRF